MRKPAVLLATAALVAGLAGVSPTATAAPGDRGGGLEVYVGELTPGQVDRLSAEGLDREDIRVGAVRDGSSQVEVVMSERQAAKLQASGLDLSVKKINGKKASEVAAEKNRSGYEVFRTYSGPDGLLNDMQTTVAESKGLAKLVNIGTSLNGKGIFAVKVTKDARRVKDGTRPAVMYGAAQHAREWITPEMVRRLMHHVLDNYGSDPEITDLVDTTELWFVPVQNPDGYDHTFTEGNRLWRKNLRDNDGNGTITTADGVDLNRNSATKWGYDNEGSSPEFSSQTYRGAGPASEPETQAMDELFDRVDFEFFINYHSAAELLLYGIGWQVSTPSPDDVIYEAMVGTDEDPAVPGYDPDISAELYTTNGDIDTHMQVAHGSLGFTPEMSTCEAASDSVPDDEWLAEDCVSGFIFPDDEELVQAEFAKNIPFALATAKSAHDPDDPVSAVGLDAADLVADPFAVSHGTEQPVAVTAKHALTDKELNYSVNGGPTVTGPVELWTGGERYGDTHHDFYGEYRGTVTGTSPGDSVDVWFTATDAEAGPVETEPFTYTVASDIGGDVLVLAAEDVTGASPTTGLASAQYADDYVGAIEASGHSADVYDVDVNSRTAPHHLGVLAHYDAVVWETGDDIITREVGQPGGTAAELALDLELTVRDYLNEGGKLLYTGKYAGFASAQNGPYWYNPFEEEQGECLARQYPCLQLLNDFTQYWLGAYEYVDEAGTDDSHNPFAVTGSEGGPYDGFSGTFNGGDSADNQNHTASFLPTSGFLPADEFPQFASSAAVEWERPGAAPYDPFTGEWYLFSERDDVSWKRLSRTIDLTGATSADLSFQTSFSTEPDWDFMVVEAHTVGQDDWTTLPDVNGITTQNTGDSCASGWDELHPFVAHYQGADCSPTGTTGSWHAASGSSGGWHEWTVDLSAYAGQQVEVAISYISDWGTQGLGSFIDDAVVTVDGATAAETSFEDDLGGWSVSGAPEGSGANDNDWTRSQLGFEEGAAVTTDDTVYTGFGAEGLTTQAMREDFVARSLDHLLGG